MAKTVALDMPHDADARIRQQQVRELAKEIEALADIEQEACQPESRDDCPADEKKDCPKKGECSDEVREFCHGKPD